MRFVVRRNYRNVAARILRQPKIRVMFLVNENQKWNSQSIYTALLRHPFFEPFVVVVPRWRFQETHGEGLAQYENNLRLFSALGLKVLPGYDTERDEFIPLRKFSPDVIFQQQLWGFPQSYGIERTSRFALICDVPYGLALSAYPKQLKTTYTRLLWRQFLVSDEHLALYRSIVGNHIDNAVVTGYPKLDGYLHPDSNAGPAIWKNQRTPARKRIFVALHHSFDQANFATFRWSHDFLLQYARDHADTTDWIFMPHPSLKAGLLRCGIASAEYYENYIEEWNSLPNAGTVHDGTVLNIMLSSDAMITDCCSFLGEYIPTGNPILHLISENSRGFNPQFGEKVVRDLYKIHNPAQLDENIASIILAGRDPKKTERMRAAKYIGLEPEGAGEKICRLLVNELRAH